MDREHPGFCIVGGKFQSSKGEKTSSEDVGNTTNIGTSAQIETSSEDVGNTTNIGTSAQIETYGVDVAFGHRSNHPSGMPEHLARKFVLLFGIENKNCQYVGHPSKNTASIQKGCQYNRQKDDGTSS